MFYLKVYTCGLWRGSRDVREQRRVLEMGRRVVAIRVVGGHEVGY